MDDKILYLSNMGFSRFKIFLCQLLLSECILDKQSKNLGLGKGHSPFVQLGHVGCNKKLYGSDS